MDTAQTEHGNSDEQKPASENEETESSQQDLIKTNTMEVHHHSDLHHKKKHWREYFLEFLMIFLAVTLGFFAENLREHISESNKEKVFAGSLYADFKTDTITLHQLVDFTVLKIKDIDSLEIRLHNTGNRHNDSALYYCIIQLISTFQFDNVNGTYEQIKSSGFLRFFKQSLVNNLNSYDATSLKLKLMEDWENKFLFEKVEPQTQQMFNYKVFNDLRAGTPVMHNMYLKNMNEESVDILINEAEDIKRLRNRQLNQHRILLQKANEILAGLKEEYHL